MNNDKDVESAPQDERASVTITREMYEDLRDTGSYIGEDPYGTPVHLSEDFQTVRGNRNRSDVDAWGPVFDIDDGLDETEPVADPSSKKTLLRGEKGDTIQISTVHRGMYAIPERFEITRRTNTYFGPKLKLKPTDEGQEHRYELTCPGPESNPVLWRDVTDADGATYSRAKVAEVSVEIFNVSGYDVCGECEEPIKSPLHRSAAVMGKCPGGFDE